MISIVWNSASSLISNHIPLNYSSLGRSIVDLNYFTIKMLHSTEKEMYIVLISSVSNSFAFLRECTKTTEQPKQESLEEEVTPVKMR